MDQIVYAFIMALMAIASNIIWLIILHFRPSPLGSQLEQNFEIIETITPPNDTTPKMSYAGTRSKQRTTTALTP